MNHQTDRCELFSKAGYAVFIIANDEAMSNLVKKKDKKWHLSLFEFKGKTRQDDTSVFEGQGGENGVQDEDDFVPLVQQC